MNEPTEALIIVILILACMIGCIFIGTWIASTNSAIVKTVGAIDTIQEELPGSVAEVIITFHPSNETEVIRYKYMILNMIEASNLSIIPTNDYTRIVIRRKESITPP